MRYLCFKMATRMRIKEEVIRLYCSYALHTFFCYQRDHAYHGSDAEQRWPTNFHTKLILNGQLQYHTEVHGLLDKLDNMYTKFYLNST